MPGVPEWEYAYRWSQLAELGLDSCVAELDDRDASLEHHMRSFGGGCSVDFEYTYAWDQILGQPLEVQKQWLDARDVALEQAIADSGGCTFEFTYRWSQFWEELLAGEAWAIGCAEENDRGLELRFGLCTCVVTFGNYRVITDAEITVPPYTQAIGASFQLAADDSIDETDPDFTGFINFQFGTTGTPWRGRLQYSPDNATWATFADTGVVTTSGVTFDLFGMGSIPGGKWVRFILTDFVATPPPTLDFHVNWPDSTVNILTGFIPS